MSLLGNHVIVERDQQFKLPQLHLRELGLRNVPAVPVDIAGILDTLVKLGLREKQCELAYQGFTRTFTIGGTTARAHAFLFGEQTADAQQAAARESLRAFLGSSPREIPPSALAERLKEQDEQLTHGANGGGSDRLTRLSLDDPKQGGCRGPRSPTSTPWACRALTGGRRRWT